MTQIKLLSVDIVFFILVENWLDDSRDGVVEGDHGAADHGDVHDVPVIPQVRPGMQHKTTIQDLKKVFGMYLYEF